MIMIIIMDIKHSLFVYTLMKKTILLRPRLLDILLMANKQQTRDFAAHHRRVAGLVPSLRPGLHLFPVPHWYLVTLIPFFSFGGPANTCPSVPIGGPADSCFWFPVGGLANVNSWFPVSGLLVSFLWLSVIDPAISCSLF